MIPVLPAAPPDTAPPTYLAINVSTRSSTHKQSTALPRVEAARPALPGSPPLPFGTSHMTPVQQKPLWQLIVELLPYKDPETEWYSPADIAPLLGITPHALVKHCRDLWPGWEGQYRLKFSQAVSLIRRVCSAGKKLPTREELLAQLAVKHDAVLSENSAPFSDGFMLKNAGPETAVVDE